MQMKIAVIHQKTGLIRPYFINPDLAGLATVSGSKKMLSTVGFGSDFS